MQPVGVSEPTLGARLRGLRMRGGQTQADLARLAGVSVRTLRDLENDRVRRPQLASINRLVEGLGCTPAERAAVLAAVGAADPEPYRIGILGSLVVEVGGALVDVRLPPLRHLLALLALHAPASVSMEEIVDTVWGRSVPRTARRQVQARVAQLRDLLSGDRNVPPVVVPTGGGYRLRVAGDRLDVLAFRDAVDKAERATPEGVVELYGRALRLWRGPVAADVPELGGHPAAVRLLGEKVTATLAFADLASARDEPEALRWLRALAAEQPLHEGVAARLMLALAAGGEQAAALAQFDDIRVRLRDELGIQPGPDLQAAQLEILQQRTTVAGTPVPAQLPPLVGGFVGRSDVLAGLDAVRADPDTSTVVISGTAGVGKTTLAVQWAHRVADRFPDGQLYINLRGFDPAAIPLDPADAVRGFLDALGVAPERVPDPLQERIGLFRTLVYRRRMLVVLDNARDADQVRPLLPGDPTTMTVVTSRNRLTRLAAEIGAHQVVLDTMSRAEAEELIGRRIGVRRASAEPSAVREIAELCARLPLALAIVGAYAAGRPTFPLSVVAGNLMDAATSVDPAPDNPSGTGDIEMVISSSYHALPPVTARLFRLLGVHPGPDIDARAAASLLGVAPTDIRAPLTELVEAHLISEHRPGRYAFHDLLRAYAATLARSEGESADALRRVTDHYLHSLELADHLMSPLARRVTPPPHVAGVTPVVVADRVAAEEWMATEWRVLTALISRAATAALDVHVWQLAWLLWRFFEFRGHLNDWVATQELALDAARRLGDPVALEYVHRALSFAWTRLHRYDRARAHLREAVAQHDHLDDPLGHARIMLSMAWVEDQDGQPQDSLRWAERALVAFEALDDRVGTAHALAATGWALVKTGDLDRAFVLCTRALELHGDLDDAYGRADLLDTMGEIHRRWADYPAAVKYFDEGARVHRELGDRYAEGVSLRDLGDAHAASGDPVLAATAWRGALDLFEAVGHPDAVGVRARLAQS
jgi:DNA-binding SARP family transcriptional activator/tetratricopeptide (TPR) repeat protein/DNA-binding XRE family transcriptional regulator